MNATEIIDETVAYYGADPLGRRSVGDDDRCRYQTEDGRRCAVGRCLTEDAHARIESHKLGGAQFHGLAIRLSADSFDDLLKPEYRGHPMVFWERLQSLHDQEVCWSPSGGLTQLGVCTVAELKQDAEGLCD